MSLEKQRRESGDVKILHLILRVLCELLIANGLHKRRIVRIWRYTRHHFLCLFFERRSPPNFQTAWQTSLPPFFVCRLIALQIPGDRSLRRLPCAPRLRLRCSRSPECVPCAPRLRLRCSRSPSASGSGGPVLRWGHRKKPGFRAFWDSPPELREDDPLRNSPQNSPFGEIRGHADFEGENERTACPRFSKRRKMPFYCQLKSKNDAFSRKARLKSHSARYIFIESPTDILTEV